MTKEKALKLMEAKVKEQDLVMLRLPNDLFYEGRQRHYNTWFRVMFVDIDNTFIGKCELVLWGEFTLYEKGEDVRFNMQQIQHILQEGEELCYGDNVTICQCIGLCRNK